MLSGGDYLKLGIMALCLVLSAFFSASETAFLTLQRARLMYLVRAGSAPAQRIARLVQHPERLLATVLLGNNVVNTAAAALGTAVAISVLENTSTAVLVSTVGVTLVLLVFGEITPKTLAARNSERFAILLVRPLEVVERLLLPVARLMQGLGYGVARLLGSAGPAPTVTEEEIRVLISAGKEVGAVEPSEADLLEKVFHFGDRRVNQIMTPRPEIVWAEEGTTLREFRKLFSQHLYDRYPVFSKGVDNVIGVLSIKDIVPAVADDELRADDPVTHLLRPAYFVPETKRVSTLFREMREQGQSMAMVVDEYGGIAGLVTLTQLVEVIVGDLGEERQPGEEPYETLGEDVYEVDAGLGILEINERLNLGLPTGEYQTLAGFILLRLGRIPQVGEHLEHGDLRLTVTQVQGVKVERVEVRRTARLGQRGGH